MEATRCDAIERNSRALPTPPAQEPDVIVEERTYTTHPGKWREYLRPEQEP